MLIIKKYPTLKGLFTLIVIYKLAKVVITLELWLMGSLKYMWLSLVGY